MVSHASASSRTGSNRGNDLPTFVLERLKISPVNKNVGNSSPLFDPVLDEADIRDTISLRIFGVSVE